MNPLISNPKSTKQFSFFYRLLTTRKRIWSLRGWKPNPIGLIKTEILTPDISIMLITYNHEKYISDALESILLQKGNFTFEINIIDDASTDGTQQIALDYKNRFPNIINCYFNEINIGHIATQLNTFRGFQTLRGRYFAILEGDDYWLKLNKLQKQLDFLEKNLDYVACAHWTLKFYDDIECPSEHFLPFIVNLNKNEADIYSLIRMDQVFHLSSILYRNVFGINPPTCFSDNYSCEATINMTYGLFGKFYVLKEYMSSYRVHNSGLFSNRSRENIWLFHLHGFRRFFLYLGPKYWNTFAYAIFHFSRWVLRAPQKGDEVTSLSTKTQWIFRLHLIGALMVFLTTIFFNKNHKLLSRNILSRIKNFLRLFISI